MIVIDGNKSDLSIENFQNLEQIFDKIVADGLLRDRVVTDVYVNQEPFSEIYPNQAEDIESDEVTSVEIKTIGSGEMAVSITRELYKVVRLMGEGASGVADLFRQADDAEALEMYQDLLDVTRDFINMIGILRKEFSLAEHKAFVDAADEFTGLFAEMTEVLENEDWILLADLLEYEFLPAVDRWKKVIAQLREDIRTTKEQLMSDALTLLDQAISISENELSLIGEGDVEEARSLSNRRGRLINEALGTKERVSLDELLDKLGQLKSLQGRLTREAMKLHETLKRDLIRAKRENKRISGYARGQRVHPKIKNHYINKNG